jgi:hypothetical protein
MPGSSRSESVAFSSLLGGGEFRSTSIPPFHAGLLSPVDGAGSAGGDCYV